MMWCDVPASMNELGFLNFFRLRSGCYQWCARSGARRPSWTPSAAASATSPCRCGTGRCSSGGCWRRRSGTAPSGCSTAGLPAAATVTSSRPRPGGSWRPPAPRGCSSRRRCRAPVSSGNRSRRHCTYPADMEEAEWFRRCL